MDSCSGVLESLLLKTFAGVTLNWGWAFSGRQSTERSLSNIRKLGLYLFLRRSLLLRCRISTRAPSTRQMSDQRAYQDSNRQLTKFDQGLNGRQRNRQQLSFCDRQCPYSVLRLDYQWEMIQFSPIFFSVHSGFFLLLPHSF